MKSIRKIMFLVMAMSLFTIAESKAQVSVGITVGARPHRPHGYEVRPPRPSPRHVWVAEEWTPAGGSYVYKPGYWSMPPRHGSVWLAGRWYRVRGRWQWIPGHWSI